MFFDVYYLVLVLPAVIFAMWASSRVNRTFRLGCCHLTATSSTCMGCGGGNVWAPSRRDDVDELVELIVDIMMLPDESLVRIGGTDKPASMVKSRFMKLTYSHIEYVLFSLQRNSSKVANIKSYLLTTLYNSLMTMSHYYQAEVQHDLYGGSPFHKV